MEETDGRAVVAAGVVTVVGVAGAAVCTGTDDKGEGAAAVGAQETESMTAKPTIDTRHKRRRFTRRSERCTGLTVEHG
jgi:hypothetical protein